MTELERSQCIQETLQDLQEDTALLQLALLGAQAPIDRLTSTCLLRLSDYLKQHVEDMVILCGVAGDADPPQEARTSLMNRRDRCPRQPPERQQKGPVAKL